MTKQEKGSIGSSFDSFLDEQGIHADVENLAIEEIIANQERFAALDAAIARGIAEIDASLGLASDEVRRHLLGRIGAADTGN